MHSLIGDKRIGIGSMFMQQQQQDSGNQHLGGDILLENGSFLLQEVGDYTFLLEQQ